MTDAGHHESLAVLSYRGCALGRKRTADHALVPSRTRFDVAPQRRLARHKQPALRRFLVRLAGNVGVDFLVGDPFKEFIVENKAD